MKALLFLVLAAWTITITTDANNNSIITDQSNGQEIRCSTDADGNTICQ